MHKRASSWQQPDRKLPQQAASKGPELAPEGSRGGASPLVAGNMAEHSQTAWGPGEVGHSAAAPLATVQQQQPQQEQPHLRMPEAQSLSAPGILPAAADGGTQFLGDASGGHMQAGQHGGYPGGWETQANGIGTAGNSDSNWGGQGVRGAGWQDVNAGKPRGQECGEGWRGLCCCACSVRPRMTIPSCDQSLELRCVGCVSTVLRV